MVALQICERRIVANSEEIFKIKEFPESVLVAKGISDDVMEKFVDLKQVANFGTQPWYRKLYNQYKDIVTEDKAKDVV